MELIWSPNLCIFSKKSNLRKLKDCQFDKYERCSTFDGPEHFCTTTSIQDKKITEELREIADHISAKISNISYDMYEINRMIIYFKRDKNKKIYFLFCTTSRTKKNKIKATILIQFLFNNHLIYLEE